MGPRHCLPTAPGAVGASSSERASCDSPSPRTAASPAQITHTGQRTRLWNPYLILIKTRHFHLVSHCNYSPASWGRCQRAAAHEVWPAVHPPPRQGLCPGRGVSVAVGFLWLWAEPLQTQPGCRAQLCPGQWHSYVSPVLAGGAGQGQALPCCCWLLRSAGSGGTSLSSGCTGEAGHWEISAGTCIARPGRQKEKLSWNTT